jgi:putative transposase
VKYAWIDSQRTHFPIELMCQVLEVSRSGFFAWRQRQALEQPDPDARVRDDLRDLHQQSRRLYGRRRLVHALRARGHCINPKRVRRLMREEGLRGVRKGRFVPRTTDGNHDRAIACNVLARRFSVDAGVAGWVSDITYGTPRRCWPCPGFPDTTVSWDDGTGGAGWEGASSLGSSSARQSNW